MPTFVFIGRSTWYCALTKINPETPDLQLEQNRGRESGKQYARDYHIKKILLRRSEGIIRHVELCHGE